MESSITLAIASILNARRNGAVIFGAYGFPVKRVVGFPLRLNSEDQDESKRAFEWQLATKLERYFGESQREVTSFIKILIEPVVRMEEKYLTNDCSGNNNDCGRRKSAGSEIEGLFVIRIRVDGRRCKIIVNAPVKGRNGR